MNKKNKKQENNKEIDKKIMLKEIKQNFEQRRSTIVIKCKDFAC